MLLILVFIAAIAAWFFSTIAAGGAAMLMIPLVGLLISPQVVAPAVSLGAFIANPSRAWLFRRDIHWGIARWLITGSVIGAVIGAWLFVQIPATWLQIVLGVFLLSYVIQDRIGKSRLNVAIRNWWFLPIGALVAFFSGLIGGTGPIHNPFLLSYGLEKQALIATKAINSLVMQLAKLATYMGFSVMTSETLTTGLVIGLGGILGVWLARKHLVAISSERFKRYALAMMAVAGIVLLIKGVNPLLG